MHAASGLCTHGISNVGGVTAGHVGHNSSNNNNNRTSIALKSSGTRTQKRNKTVNHIQEPGTYRDHHQFKGPSTI